ncbi:hypothetical protein D4764_06G0005380 [Takifugu flavidus]|uniref:Uncharacterized protein n=1 Tax=Takifugu flavidus TaxID=433684 RepID=A0A5C6MXD6_9TELE|nr:hypothetical protein D4764_06G0005380 [Takifugu flavidus]
MFRFITDQDEKYSGKPGVSLRVSDLQVIRSTQNLSCDSCSLTRQQNCNLFKTEQKILGNIYYAAPEDNILTDDCTCRIGEIGHSDAPEGPLVSDISSKLEEYTSVHFLKAQTDLCSNVKTSGHLEPKHVEEDDVQYSEVSFRSSAPRTTGAVDSTDAIYSTVK